MRKIAVLLALLFSCPALAQDVHIIGEIHDNPSHHEVQAEMVADLMPSALVFEMLTAEQADLVTPELRRNETALNAALGWEQSGWPDFRYYYPIIRAAPQARIYGAGLARRQARQAMKGDFESFLGAAADDYRLRDPLPEDEQEAREAMQMAAHCDALPRNALAGIVMIQRLRDAMLSEAIRTAMADTGGPVVAIAGNGHARRDWGAPAFLARLAPEIELRVIGQTEDDAPLEGEFDEVISAPAAERDDPCGQFQ